MKASQLPKTSPDDSIPCNNQGSEPVQDQHSERELRELKDMMLQQRRQSIISSCSINIIEEQSEASELLNQSELDSLLPSPKSDAYSVTSIKSLVNVSGGQLEIQDAPANISKSSRNEERAKD